MESNYSAVTMAGCSAACIIGARQLIHPLLDTKCAASCRSRRLYREWPSAISHLELLFISGIQYISCIPTLDSPKKRDLTEEAA